MSSNAFAQLEREYNRERELAEIARQEREAEIRANNLAIACALHELYSRVVDAVAYGRIASADDKLLAAVNQARAALHIKEPA